MATKPRNPVRTESVYITWAPEEQRNIYSYVTLLGRILFGGYFAYSGINHFTNFGALTTAAASKGIPLPEAGVVVSGLLLLAGGISIVLGLRPRLGALLPILFLVPAAITIHNFWVETDPMAAQLSLMLFLRNIAFTGALLMIAGIPRWPLSLDRPTVGRATRP